MVHYGKSIAKCVCKTQTKQNRAIYCKQQYRKLIEKAVKWKIKIINLLHFRDRIFLVDVALFFGLGSKPDHDPAQQVGHFHW